jgi:Flp pilus assembly protein TadD
MAKRSPKSAPPRGLLVLVALGAVGAIVYAFWTSTPVSGPAADTSAPFASSNPAAPAAVADVPPPGASVQQLVSTGNARMDAGAYASAINYYTRALELDTSLVDVWVDRGACRHAMGNEAPARADFRQALSLDPVHVIAHFNMGVAYMTEGAPDSARAWWNRLLLLSPTGLHADRARALIAHLDSLEGAGGRVTP